MLNIIQSRGIWKYRTTGRLNTISFVLERFSLRQFVAAQAFTFCRVNIQFNIRVLRNQKCRIISILKNIIYGRNKAHVALHVRLLQSG